MTFTFTEPSTIFDLGTILYGTCVHAVGGSKTDGTYFEGNGVVTTVSPLSLTIELYNLHTLGTDTITVELSEFESSATQLTVLTFTDALGNELTGAIPSDLTPPAEVTNLVAATTDTVVTLTFSVPLDADFSHVNVYQEGELIASNITATSYVISGLEPSSVYNFEVKTVDNVGNISQGSEVTVTTLVEPDLTPPGNVLSLSAENVTDTTADLVYLAPYDDDFSHYQIVDGNGTLVEDQIFDTTYSLVSLLASTTYTYTVKTVDNAGNVSDGVSVTFTTTLAA